MKEKIVLIDIDGVCLDLIESLDVYFKKNGFPETNLREIQYYNFQDVTGVTQQDCFTACRTCPEVFAREKVLNGVTEAISLLKEQGYCPFAYTLVNTPEIYNIREEQIKALGFTEYLIATTKPKPVIKEAIALFDDCLDNHKLYPDFSVYHGVINASYNTGCPEYHHFDSLLEGVQAFLLGKETEMIEERCSFAD